MADLGANAVVEIRETPASRIRDDVARDPRLPVEVMANRPTRDVEPAEFSVAIAANRDPGAQHEWYPMAGETADWLEWVNKLPFCRDIGLRCVEFGETWASFQLERAPLSPSRDGAIAEGMLAAAADQAMAALAVRLCDSRQLPATGSLHIEFHRPAFAPVTLRATSLRSGRRIKFVEVVIEDGQGNCCATSQATMVPGGSKVPPQVRRDGLTARMDEEAVVDLDSVSAADGWTSGGRAPRTPRGRLKSGHLDHPRR
ncbi:PaaI family thioesterase [Mycolicibacterium sphagni]|uniref:PaaI family thioesterase n=1 Tax=Mycolicibacterium sphagni TaxID=1786 RepID=UPI0013FD772F|nr:hotdog domain-containing protein [Mycolicibacterium sphagni]